MKMVIGEVFGMPVIADDGVAPGEIRLVIETAPRGWAADARRLVGLLRAQAAEIRREQGNYTIETLLFAAADRIEQLEGDIRKVLAYLPESGDDPACNIEAMLRSALERKE